ncbi:MGMT family protein [Sulfuriroseicoccus oceanibius]|uniref:MGMT family protein n=2 Tax=Sulfuriroseicoccus oceanibius TaxID=2707525 RepID=A0A6B3L9Q1_9BACT|nr:MGMT family protein [Sulfuriroseicoccus oceanibius]
MMEESERVTEFARRVYAACSAVPEGRVTSYGELAKAIGCGSARAVGQALRANPYAPDVPCHRVVRADGSLGGYLGETGGEQLRRKVELLAREGVRFDAGGRLIEPERLVTAANLIAHLPEA